jgi:GNAT superfamily N-acetyltransferase
MSLPDAAAIARMIAPGEARRAPIMAAPTTEFARIGEALLAVDPASDSLYPSQNTNRVINLGVDAEPTERRLDEVIDFYKTARVKRFFAYLSPGPWATTLADWLTARGFTVRNELDVLFGETTTTHPMVDTLLTVRRIEPDEAQSLSVSPFPMDNWPEERWSHLLSLTTQPEFDLFLAFDEAKPVATGLLIADGELGNLAMAATLPAYRGRGAQSALIATRVHRAAERGCRYIYAETYRTILAGSFRNLKRSGLKPAYTRRIFVRSK